MCTVRENWRQEDPQLIAETLFAVTSLLSFTRLAYILPAHESLGTLQISMGRMIDDMMRCEFHIYSLSSIFKVGLLDTKMLRGDLSSTAISTFFYLYRFMFILMIIGTAFLCGINNIYVPYVVSPHLGR